MRITIETKVNAPPAVVWEAWTTPSDIMKWNFASNEWCCPRAKVCLAEGGKFSYRMEAKDGSMAFDFEGKFTKVVPNETIQFDLGNSRTVIVNFIETQNGVLITETFEADDEHSAEQQKQGWQSILNNFKRHAERKGT